MKQYFKLAKTWNKSKEENNKDKKRKGMFDWSLLCCGKPVNNGEKECQENN